MRSLNTILREKFDVRTTLYLMKSAQDENRQVFRPPQTSEQSQLLPIYVYKKPNQLPGVNAMSKEQKSNKEDKKKPALSPKEKKAVKKSKKDSKG